MRFVLYEAMPRRRVSFIDHALLYAGIPLTGLPGGTSNVGEFLGEIRLKPKLLGIDGSVLARVIARQRYWRNMAYNSVNSPVVLVGLALRRHHRLPLEAASKYRGNWI